MSLYSRGIVEDYNDYYRKLRGEKTNVNRSNNLPSDLPTEVVALNEAKMQYCDIVAKCSNPWFVRFRDHAKDVQSLTPSVRLMPLVMHALNQSKRLRRLCVSGARLVNTYPRGGKFYFVSHCVFTEWYSCLVFAWKFLYYAGLAHKRLTITLRRPKGTRRRDAERVGEFMREFRDKSFYWGKGYMLDPIGELDIVVYNQHTDQITFNALQLLMECFGDQIDMISFGAGYDADFVISHRNLFDGDDFETTQLHMHRPCKYRYLTRFGDCFR